jgi:hypothetical protein
MAIEFDPTNIRIFEGAPSGVAQRQFAIDISAGNLYYNDPDTGTWTVLSLNSPSAPGGNDTELQFNDAGSFNGDANLTWDGSVLTVTGDITHDGDQTTTGNIAAESVTTTALTVATLPGTPVAGQRAFVTDSNAASFTAGIGAIVAAGGATAVPVVYDGTNWRIG